MGKHPILANGELYAEPISKSIGGGDKERPHEYAEAKQRIVEAIDILQQKINDANEVFLDEKVLCIRLEPKFEAKSYVPYSVVSAMSNGNPRIVGGRKYTIHTDDDEVSAKLYFVRTSDAGICQLKEIIQSGERDHIEQWRLQLQTLHTIDLLDPEEKVMGFDPNWETGSAEFVLHPLPSKVDDVLSEFFIHSGISKSRARIKTYDDGITFISAKCTKDNIKCARGYNPLRAVHPMGRITLSPVRTRNSGTCPTVLESREIPTTRIGVFDGGTDDTIPLLKDYVTAIDGTSAAAVDEYLEHGSGVCSAILYGNLAGKTGSDILDPPCVSVDCYRVFPLSDPYDYELYEAIDLIENVVPNEPNIKLYNLSFGPEGAILDDSISRFTYALDKLAYEVPPDSHNPLFVVAVGNDGELPHPFNRIQSPSDIVNGLGIGAYTLDASGNKIPAGYSCQGPGREGGKTKPDLLDFGGSIDHPFIVPALDHATVSGMYGTSFAAPMVTGKIGKLMALSDKVSPHMGRTLMIHNAASAECAFPKDQRGFGFSPTDVTDVLECTDNHVTIMYSGSILPTQYLSLPIFAPHINEMSGLVTISWTVSVVVAPYGNDPDAYTNNCLEDTFVPHSMIFNFYKKGHKPEKLNLLNEENIVRVKELINGGYKQSGAPVSHPAKLAWDESDLRTVDLKWDTVIHKSLRMRSSSLFNPFLTLHAIGRNGFDSEEIRYNVAISIDAPNYSGSLYDAVLQTYQNLSPIELRNLNRLTVH